jgi:hypothetical protein
VDRGSGLFGARTMMVLTGRCACRKLDPHILVMQSAQDGAAEYATNGLGSAWDRRILVQG